MWRALLVILSAGLQIVIFPMHGPLPMWRSWLAWIALVPLLLAILNPDREGRAVSPLRAALFGYLCGVLFYAGNCYWIYQTMYLYGGMGKPFALLLLLLFSLYLGLYHALFGWLLRISAGREGKRIGLALLAAPFLWVAVELARARITSFPWDQLGMSQIEHPWLTAVAPWAGVYGISFVLAVGCASVAGWFLVVRWRTQTWSRWRKYVLVSVILIVIALPVSLKNWSGIVYIHTFFIGDESSTYFRQHNAVLLQPNSDLDDDSSWVGDGYGNKMRRYAELSAKPPHSTELSTDAHGSPDPIGIILWPESPAPLFGEDLRFQAAAADLAKKTGASLIVGNVGRGIDPTTGQAAVYNSASFFTAQGQPAGHYDKMHLVPFGEYVPFKALFGFAGGLTQNVGNMAPGRERVMFRTGGHTYGVFICYESIFADEVRLLAKNGADVLVNISDDGWYGDTSAPWQHLNMARMRAIENHRWLLRDTNTGITAAIDPAGIFVSAPRHTQTAIQVWFDFNSDTTFYTRHGDWFAWLCCTVAILVLGISRRSSRGTGLQAGD